MELRWSHRPNTYHDSVKLMRVSEALAAEPGVMRAAAVMATPLNVDLLTDDGLLPSGLTLSPEDLVIAVLAEDQAASEAALARVDVLLHARGRADGAIESLPVRTLEAAAASQGADLAVIGVPGPNAAAEAFAALRSGLHVFLFSDNVSVEDEVRLKTLAAELDLLMMGPDCGTAILGGIGLGFANRVERGPVGIVGASGTGIQQICCLLDAAGVGVAQAIGTGGRDLSAAVGGSMTRRGLKILEADPAVEIIALISKPTDPQTAGALHDEMVGLSKPVVACLLGETGPRAEGSVRYVKTLTDAARDLVRVAGRELSLHRSVTSDFRRSGKVYGLFAGGTLCMEAAQILDEQGVAHHLLDLGADEYTRGRAHPMIDPRLRTSMLADLSERDDVAAVLLDVVLGDLAHPDPAGALLPGITFQPGSRPPIVATVVGARRDPQGLRTQIDTLSEARVLVFSSNAEAAQYAGTLVRA